MTQEHLLLDQQVFEASRAMMNQKFLKIIGYFFEDTEAYLSTIKTGVENKDAAMIMPAAHTIKSSSKQLGAEYLSVLAEKLEQLSKDYIKHPQNFPEIISLALLLEEIYQNTKEKIEIQI